jgi:NADH:quinone reductase (non-electrogenic)
MALPAVTCHKSPAGIRRAGRTIDQGGWEMTHRVVVLGAGYAGLPAAKRLARQVYAEEVSVTLINASPTFAERPRLHQLATGQKLREVPIAPLLGSAVRLRVGRVVALDPHAKRLKLGDGSTVEYDTLIYGLGSTTALSGIPGVADNAFGFTDADSAAQLRDAMSGARRLVVCGGGLTGIEAAAEFAESFPSLDVELVTSGRPGGWLSDKGQRYLDKSFMKLGVRVRPNARIAAVEADRLVLADGGTVPFSVCIWAGGFTVPELAGESGLAVDDRGRIRTDDTLRSISHPDIYAIGDAAAVPGSWGDSLAMGCRSGGFTGPQVADIVAARLTGAEPRPFRFRYFHECISLGRKRALIQFLRRDETPKNVVLKGRLGIRYKNTVLNSAVTLFRWPGPYLHLRRRHALVMLPAWVRQSS